MVPRLLDTAVWVADLFLIDMKLTAPVINKTLLGCRNSSFLFKYSHHRYNEFSYSFHLSGNFFNDNNFLIVIWMLLLTFQSNWLRKNIENFTLLAVIVYDGHTVLYNITWYTIGAQCDVAVCWMCFDYWFFHRNVDNDVLIDVFCMLWHVLNHTMWLICNDKSYTHIHTTTTSILRAFTSGGSYYSSLIVIHKDMWGWFIMYWPNPRVMESPPLTSISGIGI